MLSGDQKQEVSDRYDGKYFELVKENFSNVRHHTPPAL